MKKHDRRSAWGSYWNSGGSNSESGCIPRAAASVDGALSATWKAFARQLPKGAKVLDLATGDGAVLRKLGSARSDLKLVGIDSVSVLPRGAKGMTFRAGVSMESLPFPADSFDAVTSQFGIEYGRTDEASNEIARVLRPTGLFQLIVHNRHGPIVAHNLKRREALGWAAGESDYIGKASAFVRSWAISRLPVPELFRAAPTVARQKFPTQSVAVEFCTAILQTLEMGRRAPAEEALRILKTLEERAMEELSRLDALEAAACDESKMTKLVGDLESGGLEIDPVETLSEAPGATAFAWIAKGRGRSRS